MRKWIDLCYIAAIAVSMAGVVLGIVFKDRMNFIVCCQMAIIMIQGLMLTWLGRRVEALEKRG